MKNPELKKLLGMYNGKQAALAAAFGVTEQAVSRWMRLQRLPRARAEHARDRWGLDAARLMGVL